MSFDDEHSTDVFLPNGMLRHGCVTPDAHESLIEALRLTRETRWDCMRSPHVLMGLLSAPNTSIRRWAHLLDVDPERLLEELQRIFEQQDGPLGSSIRMHREFFSDNVIRLLRDAVARAQTRADSAATPMDLLICLLTTPDSVVVECFEQSGVSADRLTECAFLAEQRATDSDAAPAD